MSDHRCLLDALLEQLRRCGLELAADAALQHAPGSLEDSISLSGGMLHVSAQIVDRSERSVHVHVVTQALATRAPGGVLKFEACHLGFGAGDDALRDAAQVWRNLAFSPIASLLLRKPVLEASHFHGDEAWAVPGRHGFVGPVIMRGKPPLPIDEMVSAPIFQDGIYPESPLPRLAKSTLAWDGRGWTRRLEFDGHGEEQRHENARLGIELGPDFAMAVRFAAFFTPPKFK